MKFLFVGLCAIVFGALTNGSPTAQSHQLLGSKECTMGPKYWCENFSTAKNCHAVRHCIQTVWETRIVPEDDNPICKKCKEMVNQAREQLRSNETMEELREVFEGSCKLIPIKEVSKECCRLADNFVPELVEALSSEMNPDQVCTVAGLCNNEKIHKMWFDYYKLALEDANMNGIVGDSITTEKPQPAGKKPLSCIGCNSIANVITSKFHSTSRDVILENILHLCSKMSSFADGCMNIALVYFNDIYDHLNKNLDADGICHISGVCSSKYHSHPEDGIEIQTKSDVGYVAVQDGEDIPCEMCEQLVNHLRELLVANTTEIEFKDVLRVLCSQTKNFKEECLSIVDQYYAVIYQNLVSNLDANGACFLIGVCPKGDDVMPGNNAFVPTNASPDSKVSTKKKVLGANEPLFTQKQISEMQLPIDTLMGAANPGLLIENGQLCVFCEYFLHFVQEALSTPENAENIERVVKSRCDSVPKSIEDKCKQFVDEYGDAFIALLIQGLDPREVCPRLAMCPAHSKSDVEIFAPGPIDISINSKPSESDKPTCPLCLLAVEQAQTVIKKDKSKQNIINVLSDLCNRLPQKLKDECVDFVNTYSKELVDKLIGNFTPQQICVDLDLCTDSNPHEFNDVKKIEHFNEDSSENEISDDIHLDSYLKKHVSAAPNCLLCEEVIRIAEKKIVNKTSKEEIKLALEKSCDKLKKTLREDCHKYVEKYGDEVADLIMKQMSPKLICREIGLCLRNEQDDLEIDEALLKYDIIAIPTNKRLDNPQCVLCEFIITKLETELKEKSVQDEIRHAVKNICMIMPKTVIRNCNKFMEQYADMIIDLMETVPPKAICQQLMVCFMELDKIINDDVVECGVCHGATVALTKYYDVNKEHNFENEDLISAGCQNLPSKYYESCSGMLTIYGQSIMHLVMNSSVDHSHICAQIGKCFEHENSAGAYVRLTGTPNRTHRSTKLVGTDPCSYGPAYWCDNEEKTKECRATEFCKKYLQKKNGSSSN